MSRSLRALVLCNALSLVLAAMVQATTFILPALPDLLAASSVVVLGRVEAIRSVQDNEELRTNISLRVEEAIKGPASASLTIVEPGGLVGDRRRWIYGVPTFFVGERVLLFLQRNARHELETTSLALGKFSVVRSRGGAEFAVRNLQDAHVLVQHGRRLDAAPTVATHRLRDLLDQVRRLPAGATREVTSTDLAQAAEGSRWQEHFVFAGPPPMRWFLPDQGEPIPYHISTDADAGLGPARSQQTFDAALAAWSLTGCSNLSLEDVGSAPPASFNSCDGVTEVTFNDPFSEIADPIGCTGVLALGGVCADSQEPENFNGTAFHRITEGDVLVSNGYAGCPFWTGTNLAEIITHEIGHTLGLAHSSEDPNETDPTLRNATMYYTAHFDGRGATLMSDDIAGICALYPAGSHASVELRRFAIVSGPPGSASDRLLVDGLLLDGGGFDPTSNTLILDLRAGGASVFRLTVAPSNWLSNSARTRLVYRSTSGSGTTTLVLSPGDAGNLRFRLYARGLDLSGAQSDPVTMVLALGGTSVTQTTPALRTSAGSRVYP